MPDKGKINFTDKQFADFAWSEMEQILDKEMPVGKKRRIVAWYWLAASILFLFTLGVLISQPKKNLITKATSIENINNNSPKLADNNTADLPQKHATLNTKTAKNIITAKGPQKLTDNTDDLSQKRATLNTKTTLSSTKNNSKTQAHTDDSTPNTLVATLEPKVTNVIKTSDQSIDLSSTKDEVSENKVLFTEKEKVVNYSIAKINTIPSYVTHTMETNKVLEAYTALSKDNTPTSTFSEKTEIASFSGTGNRKLSAQSIKKEKKSPKKPIIPAFPNVSTTIYAKAQTTSFAEINGYEAGLMFTKNINKSKWSVGVGLSFSSEIVQLTLDTLALGQHVLFNNSSEAQDHLLENENILFDIFSAQSYITGPGLMPTSSLSNISTINLQLQYVSLPIIVNYKVSPRFKIYAGISPSFLIKSKIIFGPDYIESISLRKMDDFYSSVNQQFSVNNTSIPLEQHALKLTSNVHAPIKIKRFKLPIHLGVNYQLTRHFGLTLDATVNLQPIVKQDFIKTDFGRFKLGAYWRF